ncbi:hypothetical protein VB735_22290 [Halotia wernerae UHCC 0503]|nr:hypothetical protein [Halotia wernerae UHCC 0503]
MYEIAKYFLEFAKELVGLGSSLQKAELEKRLRLAQLIESISTCLESIADSFREGKEPHKSCGELDEYVRLLPEVLDGVVSEETSTHFLYLLSRRRAHARAVMFIMHDQEPLKREIALMDKALVNSRHLQIL